MLVLNDPAAVKVATGFADSPLDNANKLAEALKLIEGDAEKTMLVFNDVEDDNEAAEAEARLICVNNPLNALKLAVGAASKRIDVFSAPDAVKLLEGVAASAILVLKFPVAVKDDDGVASKVIAVGAATKAGLNNNTFLGLVAGSF